MCNRMCTKGFLNYLCHNRLFESCFKGEIINFSNNCGTFSIKESGGVKFQLWNFKRIIIIIINYHNGSGKSRKFSRSRMTKRTASLNSSREI